MPRGQRKSSVERLHRWSASAWGGGGESSDGGSDEDDDDDDDDDGDDDDSAGGGGGAGADGLVGGGAGGSGVVGTSPPPPISPGCGQHPSRRHTSPRREVTKSLRQSCASYAAKRPLGHGGVITSGVSGQAQLVPFDQLLDADGAVACCRGGDDGVVCRRYL